MLCLKDLRGTTLEKSSEQEVESGLSMNTVIWRVPPRLLGSGRGAARKLPLCTNYGRDLRPSAEKPRGPQETAVRTTHGQCGSYMPFSSLANLVGSISSMSQLCFFLSTEYG